MTTNLTVQGLFQDVPELFATVEDSNFARFLEETLRIVQDNPRLLAMIEDDQDRHAKKKKHMRLKDKRWRNNQQSTLNGMEEPGEDIPEPEELTLEGGRPRTEPIVVYILLVTRGYLGGVSSRQFQDFVAESRTLEVVMTNVGRDEVPARSTVSENVNGVSNETRRAIHRCQLEAITDEGLDDCQELSVDSTAVWADTAYPTDASILVKLAHRAVKQASRFEQLDESLENYQPHWTGFWLDKMRTCQYEIQHANHDGTYKKWYRTLYNETQKIRDHLQQEADAFDKRFEPEEFAPSRRKKIQQNQQAIRRDLNAIQQVLEYSRDRVLNNGSTAASKKVLSVADPDASWITKGGRDPVVGYRPRISRSSQGFVTELNVPVGNPSDSTQLVDAVNAHEANTGVTPDEVIADDGYANQAQRERLMDREEIEEVCITGAKGKRMISDERWENESYQQMRRKRSAVESSIFALKDGFCFGQLARRGANAVRAELLEDVIAYNFCHMQRVRSRNQDKKIPKAA